MYELDMIHHDYDYPGLPLSETSNTQTVNSKSRAPYVSWSAAEDQTMTARIEELNQENPYEKGFMETAKFWNEVSRCTPGRTSKQCRERWRNAVDPGISHEPWSEEEDKNLMSLHAQFGNKWTRISDFLPGRTENGSKSRFKSLERIKLKQWTPEEDQIIIAAFEEVGPKWRIIQNRLSGRTLHAVKVRMKSLSLDGAFEKPSVCTPNSSSVNTAQPEDENVRPVKRPKRVLIRSVDILDPPSKNEAPSKSIVVAQGMVFPGFTPLVQSLPRKKMKKSVFREAPLHLNPKIPELDVCMIPETNLEPLPVKKGYPTGKRLPDCEDVSDPESREFVAKMSTLLSNVKSSCGSLSQEAYNDFENCLANLIEHNMCVSLESNLMRQHSRSVDSGIFVFDF